ncbi:MAG: endolytic transglycosylase MltG [Chlorobiaceae bacterium]
MASSKKTSATKRLKVILAIVLAITLSFFFIPGLNTSSNSTKLTIHRGTGFIGIVEEMARQGTIRERWPVLLTARIIPRIHNIKPGRYTIPGGMSNLQLLLFLHFHPQDEMRVTLPEGLDLRKVSRILSRKLDIDSSAFMAAARDTFLLRKYRIKAENAEGYLFPGTYNFAWASSPSEAAGFLVGRFRRFYSDSLRSVASRRGLTETQLLTLASIVEAETPVNAEKPLVASVYLNRLKKNMRLQADPTVQYALGGAARHLYYGDLGIDSPYNTYRHNGLPPGPICNPGSASILAVLKPANTRFIYFVATGTGGHNFAETLAQHGENIKKYRKARRESSR